VSGAFGLMRSLRERRPRVCSNADKGSRPSSGASSARSEIAGGEARTRLAPAGRFVSGPVRYRARIAYVGTHFHGWQRQANAPRTVQAVLEAALSELDGDRVVVHAAGRTDAGVHAEGQVVHFDLSRARESDRILDGANALLPWDARVMEVGPASPDFHARRDAVWKEYLYRWSRARVLAPRDALFVAPIASRADAARMREAARDLPGRRDFGVFGVRQRKGEPSERFLHSVRIEEAGEEIHALFRGDAFVRGMVRSLCGVLAHVGRGKVPAGRLAELLESQDRGLLAPKAPARGLTLIRVHYDSL
jgi:tRNA pseudouridine38-40 synthase